MKNATVGNVKPKVTEGVSSPRNKEVLGTSPQKVFQGSPRKGKGPLKPGQKPIKCYRCDGWGHGWRECPTLENLNWRELIGAVVSSTPGRPGSTPIQTPNLKSMIYKLLRQSDLYHNLDPLHRLVGRLMRLLSL